MEPSFFAIVVSDMESSLDWYQEKLGFELLNEVTLEERGIRQANLGKGTLRLELIQTQTSVSLEQVIDQNPGKRSVQGFFKAGFTTDDIDFWKIVLEKLDVQFRGDMVADENGKRMFIILDPDGNRLQFFEK